MPPRSARSRRPPGEERDQGGRGGEGADRAERDRGEREQGEERVRHEQQGREQEQRSRRGRRRAARSGRRAPPARRRLRPAPRSAAWSAPGRATSTPSGAGHGALVVELERGPVEHPVEAVERGAVAGIGVEAGVDLGHEGLGQIRPQLGQRGHRLADLARGLRRGPARHRVLPRPRLVQAEAERVDVGLGTGVLALRLLGRHVGQRADDLARSAVRVGAPATAAIPKSISFARRPPESKGRTIAFWGFTSRCTTPRPWAWPSASQRSVPIRATSRSEIDPSRATRSSVDPSTSSLTSRACPSRSPSS